MKSLFWATGCRREAYVSRLGVSIKMDAVYNRTKLLIYLFSLSAFVFLVPVMCVLLTCSGLETNAAVGCLALGCTQVSITSEGGARGHWLMLYVITDGYPRDEMIYKWRRNSVQAADQKSWRLYQFDFMGLRNTTDIIKTTAGNFLLYCLDQSKV